MSMTGVRPAQKESNTEPRKGNQRETKDVEVSSSTSSSLSSSSSSSSSSDDSSNDERAMVTRAKKGKKKEKKYKKLKSGISEKSCCADMEYKCKWPSSMLDCVFEDDEIPFKDLTMAQFLFGELCIWDRPKTKQCEIKTRQYLLKKMVKNESKLRFKKSKEIYKMFLTRVEKGIVNWKCLSDIDRIETEVVLKCISLQEKASKSNKFDFEKRSETIWCKEFNKGTCTQNNSHDQLFQGKVVKVSHICRKCYTKKREKNKHRESDTQYPCNE